MFLSHRLSSQTMGILQTFDEDPDCFCIICKVASLSFHLEMVDVMLQEIPFLTAGFPWSMRCKYECQHCKALILTNPLFHPQDLSKLIASMPNVHVNPLNFTLASLVLLSFVRSAAASMSVNHSSSMVESCSLKTAMSCSNEFVRYDCFCVVHKVFVYCHITSLKGSVCVGGGGGWSAIEGFCSSHSMQSKVSAGCPSPASTCWCRSFITLVSAVNLSWLLYTWSSGWPSASGPPKATVASVLWVLSLLISAGYESSVWKLMSLSKGHPVLPWWVAIACILYVVQ